MQPPGLEPRTSWRAAPEPATLHTALSCQQNLATQEHKDSYVSDNSAPLQRQAGPSANLVVNHKEAKSDGNAAGPTHRIIGSAALCPAPTAWNTWNLPGG